MTAASDRAPPVGRPRQRQPQQREDRDVGDLAQDEVPRPQAGVERSGVAESAKMSAITASGGA